MHDDDPLVYWCHARCWCLGGGGSFGASPPPPRYKFYHGSFRFLYLFLRLLFHLFSCPAKSHGDTHVLFIVFVCVCQPIPLPAPRSHPPPHTHKQSLFIMPLPLLLPRQPQQIMGGGGVTCHNTATHPCLESVKNECFQTYGAVYTFFFKRVTFTQRGAFEHPKHPPPPRTRMSPRCKCLYIQLGTFSVNAEWVCGCLFAVSGEIRTHRSRTRSAESARPLRVILDSVGYH